METIYAYIESIFINLPRTTEMDQLKADMLINMEDKYLALKEAGVSDNEAIGTVLSEFGNIDEIIEEYNLEKENESFDSDPNILSLSNQEAEAFLVHRTKFAFAIALGVFMCIISVTMMFLTMSLTQWLFSSNAFDLLGVIVLLVIIAIAVALFIIFGLKESNFGYDKKELELDPQYYLEIKKEYNLFKTRFTYAIAFGVALCILGPVILLLSLMFLPESYIGISLLLSFIAVGVFLFVFFGIQKDSYEKLLRIGEHSPIRVKANQIQETVSSIVFPLATLYFLYQGFFHGNWDTAWVVFPIVGIGFVIFAAIVEALANIREKK